VVHKVSNRGGPHLQGIVQRGGGDAGGGLGLSQAGQQRKAEAVVDFPKKPGRVLTAADEAGP
jgi:hypothetical protein